MNIQAIQQTISSLWQKFNPTPESYLSEITPRALKDYVDAFLGSDEGALWAAHIIQDDPALSQFLPDAPEMAMEQLLQYQGLHAIAVHRKAHALYTKGDVTQVRALSQAARRLTAGIEIHPGAKIGKKFFIDHGAGVVIGETAELGDGVMLYHRVTLGNDGTGDTVKRDDGTERRHPKLGHDVTLSTGAEILGAATLGDNVVVGAGARIIGAVKIGDNVTIAPGMIVRQDVPDNVRLVPSHSPDLGALDKETNQPLPNLPNARHGADEPFTARLMRLRKGRVAPESLKKE
jgi:serine O-acetyltransferase